MFRFTIRDPWWWVISALILALAIGSIVLQIGLKQPVRESAEVASNA